MRGRWAGHERGGGRGLGLCCVKLDEPRAVAEKAMAPHSSTLDRKSVV